MNKILSFAKTNLKNASHLTTMEYFQQRLATLPSQTGKDEEAQMRARFTEAVAKEAADFKQVTKSELTQQIAEADARRDKAYQTIKTIVHAFLDAPVSEQQALAATAFYGVLVNYKLDTRAQLDEETGVLNNIIEDIDKLAQAVTMEQLGLGEAYRELRESNALVTKLLLQRDADRAPLQTGVMRADRAQLDQAYDALVEWFNACALIQPNNTLLSFISVWNSTVNRIRIQILQQSASTSGVEFDPNEENEGGDDAETPTPTPTPQPGEDEDLSKE